MPVQLGVALSEVLSRIAACGAGLDALVCGLLAALRVVLEVSCPRVQTEVSVENHPYFDQKSITFRLVLSRIAGKAPSFLRDFNG